MKGIWNKKQIVAVGDTCMYRFATAKEAHCPDMILTICRIESGWIGIDSISGDNISIISHVMVPFPREV